MPAGSVRRGLHIAHATTAIVLVATGLLILLPELRSQTIGGYGQETGQIHVYAGLAFAAAPLLACLWVPRGLLTAPWERTRPHDFQSTWRRTHIIVSLIASAALTVSGLVLWLGVDLPTEQWDAADQVHVICHWVVTATIPLHLVASRRGIARRLGQLIGR